MQPRWTLRVGDHGMILFSSLAILSVMLMVGVGARVMLQNDYRVLTNLRGSSEAFYLAAAGLAWSKNEIARANSFPPTLTAHSESFAGGTFAVTFPTATPIGPLSAKIVVRSTGSIGAAAHTMEAQLRKTYDLADGAVSLRGNGSQVAFGTGSVFASGRDHDPATGEPNATAKSRPAVAAGDAALLGLVNAAASALPPGSLESDGSTATSAMSEYLPGMAINQMVGSLCGQANAILSTVPPTGALAFENQAWGSRSAPELRCIDGLVDPGDGVMLAGNTSGNGILIVKNADLIVTGSLRWEGLIIVTGADVSFKVTGSSAKDVLGGLIVNETGSPTSKAILDIQGNLRLLFSRQALGQTAQLIAPAGLAAIYAHLPMMVRQDYWRAITP